MFPPEKTDDPQKMLTGLWESVSRGGPLFRDNVRCLTKDSEQHGVFYFAPGPVLPAVKAHLMAFMRQYISASGWTIKRVKTTKDYVDMTFSRRASSKSKSR